MKLLTANITTVNIEASICTFYFYCFSWAFRSLTFPILFTIITGIGWNFLECGTVKAKVSGQ